MSDEQHDRRMFNEGVLFGLRYLRDDLRGQLRGVEGEIEKVERALSDPLADETPYELWLDKEEERPPLDFRRALGAIPLEPGMPTAAEAIRAIRDGEWPSGSPGFEGVPPELSDRDDGN